MKQIIKNKYMGINFRNINIPIVMALIIASFMFSCQKDELFGYVEEDLPYLSLSADFSGFDIEKTSDADWHVFHLAHQRMDIQEKNGVLYTKWKSGEQINVSEELFDFFVTMLNNTTREHEENGKIASSFPRLKQGGETEEEETNSPNDCVARAIVDVMKSFGKTNVSVAEVNAWIRAHYGSNGVPSSKFAEVVSHFLEGGETSLPSNYEYSASSKKRYIVVERPNNTGDGHAGMLMSTTGTKSIYRDSQNKGYNSFDRGAAAKVYEATGVK
ncbi:MAG: hypothetical protein LBL18_02715 [Bacteroidales bacterium]|nr:hypothetical protein [Bacteroidales bacterium]